MSVRPAVDCLALLDDRPLLAASESAKRLREADFRRDDLAGHSQLAAYPMGTQSLLVTAMGLH
jgi:hypothetical protein